MQEMLTKIAAYVDAHREEMVEAWRTLVNLQSYAKEKEHVELAMEFLKSQFEAEGVECHFLSTGEITCHTLSGILGAEREGKPFILSGHVDTVFPEKQNPSELFRIIDGKAYGPGVLDMKGGVIIALYVIKALNHIGYDARPIKILFSGDEEITHEGGNGGALFLEESKGALCAFNMETGLINNCLCIGRKGVIKCYVTVKGISAHAGNDFEAGRNAIEEMCHKILRLQALTDLKSGLTVNVGTIQGGTVSNAVPGLCKIEVDIRYEKVGDLDQIQENLRMACETHCIPDTVTETEIKVVMQPYETTEDVLRLYRYFCDTAEQCGFKAPGSVKLGGASDASYVVIAGVPALCSCGVQGEWNHTDREYAVVESLFERT